MESKIKNNFPHDLANESNRTFVEPVEKTLARNDNKHNYCLTEIC